MQGELVTRRTQFSSCDECRRSRVACDASARAKTLPDDEGEAVSCTRCLNRRKPCTFKWVKENKAAASKKSVTRRRSRRKRASPAPSETTTSQINDSADPSIPTAHFFPSPGGLDWSPPFVPGVTDGHGATLMPYDLGYDMNSTSPVTNGLRSLPSELLTASESLWLSTIYHMGFSTVFSSWMGRYGNPFVNENPLAQKYVNVVELCGRLDKWMADETSHDQADGTATREEAELDRRIDQSLHTTIAAYSARWLPLVSIGAQQDPTESKSIQNLWRYARRDMLRVMNRPCYRSMLSLFLFALTPIPAGVSDEEEVDGITGQACVHAALQLIQVLRARQRNLQFSGSKVSPYLKKQAIPTSPESISTSDFIIAENTAYWAALTFDTSASLTLNCRSLLSSGLFGHNEELSWRLVRTCAKIFDDTAQRWQPGSLDITDERANQIVAAGAQWKLLGWKLTAIFKEALRDGHEDSKVMQAYTAVVESVKQFNTIFRPRLEACQRRMHFLSQSTKLRWYSIMLHYHLSILMLVDIMEATDRNDLLADVQEAAADAENTVMNTLVFGLHNTYTLTLKGTRAGDGTVSCEDGTRTTITVPLTSIDPYPHHILAGVQLVRKAIQRDYGQGKITDESYANLQSTLERTLSLLPQSSKSVQAARRQLSEKLPDNVLDRHQDPYMSMQRHFTE